MSLKSLHGNHSFGIQPSASFSYQSPVPARRGIPASAGEKSLSELGIGKNAVVSRLDLPEEVQHHLMHMGFIPEARVTALRRAPAGDPTVYAIDGMEIALRRDTARAIQVRQLGDSFAPVREGGRQ